MRMNQLKSLMTTALLLSLSLIFCSCDNINMTSKQDHEEHDEHGEEDLTSIELSDQAIKNIGLKPGRIKLGSFVKTVTFPGMIIAQPSKTKTVVATPMTGIVTNVYVQEGEAVMPDKLLFKIRLTHEDLVQIQSSFLETLGKLDVEIEEINRLQKLTKGLVAKKVILERKYSQATLNAVKSAQKEALQLHGLNDSQIAQIENSRKLLKELSIYAPSFSGKSEKFILTQEKIEQVSYSKKEPKKRQPVYIVQNLKATKGANLSAGNVLCTLVDYHNLLIEGSAFEHDASILTKSTSQNWNLTALREGNKQSIDNLKIQYLSNAVDTDSRALHFYINLPNEITRDITSVKGIRYINWKYRPGERVQLKIPVEKWEDKIVIPVDGVVHDGAEYYVFHKKGNIFKQTPVHVEYRNRESVVIQNDGSLKLGWKVAFTGAYQINIALKNKAGGGVDPHAGHTH
jgi:membrane fusion protein, heavy metal efflux system